MRNFPPIGRVLRVCEQACQACASCLPTVPRSPSLPRLYRCALGRPPCGASSWSLHVCPATSTLLSAPEAELEDLHLPVVALPVFWLPASAWPIRSLGWRPEGGGRVRPVNLSGQLLTCGVPLGWLCPFTNFLSPSDSPLHLGLPVSTFVNSSIFLVLGPGG